MKKYLSIIICAFIIFAFCACSNSETEKAPEKGTEAATDNNDLSATTTVLPSVINPTEYLLYQNIFYNQQGSAYEGKEVTKIGTFATIDDRFNNITRYYVWGYNDNTKCCDWQWEIRITDTSELPKNGSLVEVTGTFASDDISLDGYWIKKPTIKVVQEYQGPVCDVDMATMSATLERVQLINIQQHPADFEGKSIYMYGRVATLSSIQHPYYDNVWTQEFETADTTPAIGTYVILNGTFSNGVITDSSIAETDVF